ncbi:hypothetical protein BGLA2_1080078 [Burkholderia gladioli]|nr:hypothetical protein BGLA2_1080078 [Burkholderia gladioli]
MNDIFNGGDICRRTAEPNHRDWLCPGRTREVENMHEMMLSTGHLLRPVDEGRIDETTPRVPFLLETHTKFRQVLVQTFRRCLRFKIPCLGRYFEQRGNPILYRRR